MFGQSEKCSDRSLLRLKISTFFEKKGGLDHKRRVRFGIFTKHVPTAPTTFLAEAGTHTTISIVGARVRVKLLVKRPTITLRPPPSFMHPQCTQFKTVISLHVFGRFWCGFRHSIATTQPMQLEKSANQRLAIWQSYDGFYPQCSKGTMHPLRT